MVRTQATDCSIQDAITLMEQIPKEGEQGRWAADALEVLAVMPTDLPRITAVWCADGEAAFEWMIGDTHAILSCEGDGVIGYAYHGRGQNFKPGEYPDPPVTTFPPDLATFLRGCKE